MDMVASTEKAVRDETVVRPAAKMPSTTVRLLTVKPT